GNQRMETPEGNGQGAVVGYKRDRLFQRRRATTLAVCMRGALELRSSQFEICNLQLFSASSALCGYFFIESTAEIAEEAEKLQIANLGRARSAAYFGFCSPQATSLATYRV